MLRGVALVANVGPVEWGALLRRRGCDKGACFEGFMLDIAGCGEDSREGVERKGDFWGMI